MKYRFLISILILNFLLTSCNGNKTNQQRIGADEIQKNNISTRDHHEFSLQDFYNYDSRLAYKTDSIFNTMSDSERVAQMIVSSIGELGHSLSKAKRLVKNNKVGGFVILKDTKEEHKKAIEELNLAAKKNKSLGLLFSADAEPSLLNSRIIGSQTVKNTIDINSLSEADSVAKIISNELKHLGVHQNYAPVLDVSENNSAIKNRSFGSNPKDVIDLSNAFIKSTQNENIVATVKHFPGHGLVKGDSHFNSVYIDGDLLELDNYKPIINNDVISVMVAHISIKNNPKYNTFNVPASCSKKIVTGLLKNELNFKGLVISDGMKMKALQHIPNATLEASKAGCDIILIPKDEKDTAKLILQEMKTNAAYKSQVYESVMKIIRLKICLGIA
ncbi:glycoside hydrolase family 3 N-terminal domain-containing protein [Winogradskyella thalassocola]|uniref:beta-N-acetylhexosaminidase n=1 Tax=Winogradskyella thalassocola TaxID=262004 RepID=A0A1G7VN79_9FLAO|nr:glycoside hydrolase family 3 N-terminal domain-containing protein [Winogradskyella thalassocola]SDG61031.1 beta-N-acetylhexosaminidase [Winogradskyella thalassocola]